MDKGKGARGTEQKEDKELQDMKLQEALKQAIVLKLPMSLNHLKALLALW